MVKNDLETVLMRRAVPPMRSNLAERIIAAAPQHQSGRLHGIALWLADFVDSFAIPQPAFALTAVLLVGIVVGWAAMPQVEDTADNISSYLYMNEVLNMGDWLL